MNQVLKDWLDSNQRMEIARAHGVTSRRQVYNVMNGISKNYDLLKALVEKAEENKALYERARQLEQPKAA
jgi:hypothetical protein